MNQRLTWVTAGVIASVCAYVAVVILSAWPHVTGEIIRERSPLGFLSSLLLTAAGAIALAQLLRPAATRRFAVLAGGLFLLALDERFMGHERLKKLILVNVYDYDKAAMGVVGDLPLVVVALLGLGLLWKLRDEFKARPVRLLLIAAVGCGALSLLFDVATLHPTGQLIEELLELNAETLFLIAVIWQHAASA